MMAVIFKCDGCGAEAPALVNSLGDPRKPEAWFCRSDEDGRQDACSRACIATIAAKTGKTGLVIPL